MKFTLVSSCVALVVMALSVEAAPGGKKLSIPLSKNNAYKPNAKAAVAKAVAKFNKNKIQPLKVAHLIQCSYTIGLILT